MLHLLFDKIGSFWEVKKEFRSKVFFLSTTFLLMSGCQAIWRPLKTSIFTKLVGRSFVPDAKIYSIFLFILPLILIYSKLVDWLRRHQLLYCFTMFHAAGGVIFYFLLSHPVYGIANTNTSPDRLVGWALYFFMESFAAFFATSFWSFADSINSPDDAKNYYGLFVAGSKLGGIVTSGGMYFLINLMPSISDAVALPRFLLLGSVLLTFAATSIYFLMKKVPGYYMHGYEAVYKIEKQKETIKTKESIWSKFRKPLEGLIIMLKKPYVMGIFALVLCYEITIVIFDYIVLVVADAQFSTAGQLTAYYAKYYLIMNTVGLLITIFGTTPLLKKLGIRKSLFVFPVVSIFIILITLAFRLPYIIFYALVALRALNYALNHPTREILYIPTTKDIKFKAKAWTDAFGARIAKGTGSVVNKFLQTLSNTAAILSSLTIGLGLISIWLVIVYFLGKTLQNAVKNKKVIGEEDKRKTVAQT